MMKFIFGIQINIKVFYKLILSFWVFIAGQFAYLYNISRKMWGMILIFLSVDKTSLSISKLFSVYKLKRKKHFIIQSRFYCIN